MGFHDVSQVLHDSFLACVDFQDMQKATRIQWNLGIVSNKTKMIKLMSKVGKYGLIILTIICVDNGWVPQDCQSSSESTISFTNHSFFFQIPIFTDAKNLASSFVSCNRTMKYFQTTSLENLFYQGYSPPPYGSKIINSYFIWFGFFA